MYKHDAYMLLGQLMQLIKISTNISFKSLVDNNYNCYTNIYVTTFYIT